MSSSSLDQLYAAKLRKLEEQKKISDEMNDILSKVGGLNESSRLSMKNLNAAIAVSKKPGYFDYYVASDDIKRTEEKRVLNGLARSVQKVHKELEQLNEEIRQAEHSAQAARMQATLSSTPSISSLDQWFDTYGRVTMTDEKKDRMTSFVPDSKVYGGAGKYKSFKSSSSVMVKGRLTR